MRALLLLAVTGCSFDTRIPGAEPPEAGVTTDGPEGCLAWTFMPKDFDPCAIAAPADPPQLFTGTYIIDSDTGVMTGAGGPFQLPYKALDGVGVVSLSGLVLQATVNIRGEGMKPLAIVVWGSMQLDGNIDVSSTPSNTGAGANPAACTTAGQGGAGIATNGGDGGGGGGSFGALGGKGGNGNNTTTNGGVPGAVRALPTTIAGGCRGGNAPAGDGGTPGRGGAGGGAIALVARDTLAISGIVHAGGAGGGGGSQSQTGGGGGGSGGMIRVEAATLALADTAILAANGGQGGGGCDGAAAFEGQSGRPAALEALQGNNQGAGSDGGAGGWRDRSTGAGALTSSEGGGGGGGGVGYIVYKGHPMATGIGTATFSPPAQPF